MAMQLGRVFFSLGFVIPLLEYFISQWDNYPHMRTSKVTEDAIYWRQTQTSNKDCGYQASFGVESHFEAFLKE